MNYSWFCWFVLQREDIWFTNYIVLYIIMQNITPSSIQLNNQLFCSCYLKCQSCKKSSHMQNFWNNAMNLHIKNYVLWKTAKMVAHGLFNRNYEGSIPTFVPLFCHLWFSTQIQFQLKLSKKGTRVENYQHSLYG